MNNNYTKQELEIIKEVLLFQRLLDPKRRIILDNLVSKAVQQIEALETKDIDEDELDAKYRRKIVK